MVVAGHVLPAQVFQVVVALVEGTGYVKGEKASPRLKVQRAETVEMALEDMAAVVVEPPVETETIVCLAELFV